jgi:hypothetical protein
MTGMSSIQNQVWFAFLWLTFDGLAELPTRGIDDSA